MTEQTSMRLSKRMAELGLCSRREADSYIEQGWVSVNGVKAVLGQKVTAGDRIDLNKQAHESQSRRVTILLNKPVGYVSGQPEKDYQAAVALITPENHWSGDKSRIPYQENHKKGLAPAGRLDIDGDLLGMRRAVRLLDQPQALIAAGPVDDDASHRSSNPSRDSGAP